MDNKSKSFEDLNTIRKIMEESSRFLSLSGLSGVFAGLIALAGMAIACLVIFKGNILLNNVYFTHLSAEESVSMRSWLFFDSLLVLLSAIGISILFSYRRSVRQGLKLWTPVSKRMLVYMLVPLITGAMFIIILYNENQWQLIVPAMLVFYGLALVNAGKFTYSDIFYLGVFEIIIGFASALLPEYGILFWGIGFGILHIIYGLIMYRKYEQ
jgi:hypothetical protein